MELNNSFPGVYIVDYPAARLAFIALSFALTVAVMTIYAMLLAREWLRVTRSGDTRACPTPHQTIVVIRILNAEIFVLLQLLWESMKAMHRRWSDIGPGRSSRSRSPRVIRGAAAAFTMAVVARYKPLELSTSSHIGSIITTVCSLQPQPNRDPECILDTGKRNLTRISALTQISDTYLHITTKAIEFVQLQPQPVNTYLYSRGLAPSCWDQPQDPSTDPSFWGCNVEFWVDPKNNKSRVASVDQGETAKTVRLGLVDLAARDFPGAVGSGEDNIALLVPRSPPPSVDWHATTYGVSTQCSAVRNESCVFKVSVHIDDMTVPEPFRIGASMFCEDDPLDLVVNGTLRLIYPQYQFMDFHRYI